jgi:hypothetical protein
MENNNGTNATTNASPNYHDGMFSVNASNGLTFMTGTSSSSSSSISSMWQYNEKEIIGFKVCETTVAVSYRQRSNSTYTVAIYRTDGNYSVPDRIWKEIYGLKDGRMTLLEVIQGRHVASYQVPESFEFDDEEG